MNKRTEVLGKNCWLLALALLVVFHACALRAQSSTTTTLNSSGASNFDQPVTFTATVSSSGCSPTGTVTFADTATVLGTQPLSSGTATLNVSTLSAGSHNVTAFYSGDAYCMASQSAPLSQSVGDAVELHQSLTLQPSRLPFAAVGGEMTFVATVRNFTSSTLTNVTFSETVSGNGAIRLLSPSLSCSGSAMVTCSLPNLAAGQTITLDLSVTPYRVRSITAVASSNATATPAQNSANVRMRPFIN